MTCDASAAVSGGSASQSGDRDSGDPAEIGRRSGAPLGFAHYEIIVDIGREASTAYLVRRDSKAGTAETGASSAPWGSDFCAMLLAMVTHDLRQPLQIIMAAHDALEVRLSGEPDRRHLERIEESLRVGAPGGQANSKRYAPSTQKSLAVQRRRDRKSLEKTLAQVAALPSKAPIPYREWSRLAALSPVNGG